MLRFAGDRNELQKKYFPLRQSWTKFMKQCQEIGQDKKTLKFVFASFLTTSIKFLFEE